MAEFNLNSPIIRDIFGLDKSPQEGGYPNGYPQMLLPEKKCGYTVYTAKDFANANNVSTEEDNDYINPWHELYQDRPSPQQQQPDYNQYYSNYNNSFNGYNGYNNGYNTGYGYNNGYNTGYNNNRAYYDAYAQYNQYNQMVYENLYGTQDIGGYDIYSARNIGYPKEEVNNNAVTVPYDYAQYGYYDYYGNYINPYMTPAQIRMYQEEMQKQYQEAVRQEIERNKKLSRIAHKALGEEISEETLELIYNPVQEEVKLSPEEMKRKKEDEEVIQTMSVCAMSLYLPAAEQQYRERIDRERARVTAAHNNIINPDSNLSEFLENAGKLYIESLMTKQKYQRYKDRMQYDSDAYKAMIKARNAIHITLDDNIVSLPKEWKSDYQERRARFMQAIIDSNRVGSPNG